MRRLGAELGLLGRGCSNGHPLGDSHLLDVSAPPQCQGLTAQVVSGQGRSGQVTQAVVVTLPSRGLTPPSGGGAREQARTELAAVLTLSSTPAVGQEDTARIQTLLAQDVVSLHC